MTARIEADIALHFAGQLRDVGCDRLAELAQHVAEELTGAEAAAMREHLQACPECRSLLEDLNDTAHVWKEDGARHPVVPSQFPRRLRLFVAPALALAASLIALPWVSARLTPSLDSDRLTPKGNWSLEVAVERDGQRFLAPSGARLQKGDRLGLFYSAAQDGYLTVLYADDHAASVRVFPARVARSTHVVASQNLPLSDGTMLADGRECDWAGGLVHAAPHFARRTCRTSWCDKMVIATEGLQTSIPISKIEARKSPSGWANRKE